MPGEVHLDIDPSVRPVQMPLRRLPEPIKEKVRLELEQMCRDGVIEPVHEPSAWISALLVVTWTDGCIRLCLDPKPLNKALLRSHYRMQTIDDILPLLAKAKVFSTCDAKNGFWLLKLDTDSSKLTCFETPFGRFRWLRMPFGVKPAPELFAAKMHKALRGLNGVACIADDILTYGCGETVEEAQKDHDRNFIAMLDRCRLKGIRLNKQKLQICRQVTRYMGHELTITGLQPDSRKVAAINDMQPPANRQGLMRMLGTSGFLARFCPAYSEITAVLRELLCKDNEYRWQDDRHGAAWRRLKELLTTAPVLQYYAHTG
jgi:ribosomal protein S14